MKRIVLLLSAGVVCILSGLVVGGHAEPDESVSDRITQQLKAPGRGPYDTLKDGGRKPVAAMRFFGVKSGMTVLDMVTGSGYSAEILSAAVGPNGTVYAQNSFLILRLIGGEHHRGMMTRIKGDRLPNVRYMIVDPDDMPFESTLDMVFWGLNLHDEYNGRGEASALDVLAHIKRGLKPGGILAMSDHVGIAGQDNKELHRIEPAIMMDLLSKAGFEIEATSDLLANPDDDHTQSIYTDGLRYRTDQIMVRARKPK